MRHPRAALPPKGEREQTFRRFYRELCHLIGLQEPEGKTGAPLPSPARPGGLAMQAFALCRSRAKLGEENAAARGYSLVVLWVLRLLFLKLLEASLPGAGRNRSTEGGLVLMGWPIASFADIQRLFFENVLAGPGPWPENEGAGQGMDAPLFEKQAAEQDGCEMAAIENLPIKKMKGSVLGAKAPETLPLLEYLLLFLNAYCFKRPAYSVACGEDEYPGGRLDATVLSRTFEKLNAHKSAAFYTPPPLAEYMAKEALELAVLRKANEALGWDCGSFAVLKEEILRADVSCRKRLGEALETLRICDPAAGTGHFLVAALRHLLALKLELGLLLLYGADILLPATEAILEGGILPAQSPLAQGQGAGETGMEAETLQKTLFHEGCKLAKNCLYGAELNPEAAWVCKLSLWGELLPYLSWEAGRMAALPKLCRNIQKGNALLFSTPFEAGRKVNQAERGAHHPNGVEWAHVFSELLSEEGVFLGFDCVLGNPPYVQLQSMQNEVADLEDMAYHTFSHSGNLYFLFFELGCHLLAKRGVLSFVTSNQWLRAGYGQPLRSFLARDTNPLSLVDFTGQKLFCEAAVSVCVLTLEKGPNRGHTKACTVKEDRLDYLSI